MGERPTGSVLRIILTGEPVTIVGRSRVCVELASPVTVGELFERLGKEVHPWFGALSSSQGRFPGLGEVMILFEGRRLDLVADADLAVTSGQIYIIPPITGG